MIENEDKKFELDFLTNVLHVITSIDIKYSSIKDL